MPVYEYRCKSCGHKFSRLVGVVAEPSPPACPECGSTSAEKLISRIAKTPSEDSFAERITETAAKIQPDDTDSVHEWTEEIEREMGVDDPDQDFENLIEPDDTEKTYDLDEGT